MKKLFYVVALLFIATTAIVSCKKDKEEAPASPTSEPTVKENVSKKWIVGKKSGRIVSDSNYVWFEFNMNSRFIIAESDGDFISGTYTISSDGKTITLTVNGTEFGVITITSVSTSEFSFTLTLTGSTEVITIFSTVAPTTASSAKTNLLCRTWKISKIVKDSVTYTYPDSSVSKYEVIFSKYGTYFITMVGTGGNAYYLNKKWQWSDGAENSICYGIDTSACFGPNKVNVSELSNTVLKMNETASDASYVLDAL